MYATATMGAVLVPLNPSYTAPELQFALQHSRASMLVAASACKGVDMTSTVQAAAQPLMAPEHAQDNGLLKHLLVLDASSAGDHHHQQQQHQK